MKRAHGNDADDANNPAKRRKPETDDEKEQRRQEWKAKRRALKLEKRKRREAAEEPLQVHGLRYVRPFERTGGTRAPWLHFDKPVRAGPLEVMFNQDGLIAVNKPAPLPVTRDGISHCKNNLRSMLKAQLGIKGSLKLVHQLDVCTSGVILLATDGNTAGKYGTMIKDRDVSKVYVAVVRGVFPSEELICEVPVHGKESRTTFSRWENCVDDAERTLVVCRPHTGRKHQIRIHLQSLGFPIDDDPEHGGAGDMPSPYCDDENGTLECMLSLALEENAARAKPLDDEECLMHLEGIKSQMSKWQCGGKVWTRGIHLHAWKYEFHKIGVCFEAALPSWTSPFIADPL